MGLLIVLSISIATSFLLFWIGKSRLSTIPIFFSLLYSIDSIWWLSFKSFKWTIKIEHSIIIFRYIVLVGVTLLLYHQHINRITIAVILAILNSFLLVWSHHARYKEWIEIFHWWLVWSYIITIGLAYSQWYSEIDHIMSIMSIWCLLSFVIYHSIDFLVTTNNIPFDIKNDSIQKKEFYTYLSISFLCYRIFTPNYLAALVLQLFVTSIFIAIHQQFLAYQKGLQTEKDNNLTGRAILQWKKVLQRYEEKKDFIYSMMDNLTQWKLVPSTWWLYMLQSLQFIQTVLFIGVSIYFLILWQAYTLIRYRLGVLCFILTLFFLDRQDTFVHRYKKLWIIMISGAFYMTLLSQYEMNSWFVIGSFLRNCINMIICLFYDTIVPITKRIFKAGDLLFWMIINNLAWIITIISLGYLHISGDIIFALCCIIIGMMGVFSYLIWKKYFDVAKIKGIL